MNRPSTTQGPAPEAPRSGPRWALATLSLSMLMPSLDTSIANTAFPTLATALGARFGQVQWIVLAYLLAITTLIVSIGRLGDLVGRRRLLLSGIALFTAASALCGAAPSLLALVGARALQGLGAAAMLSLTMAFVGDTVPRARTGAAMGLLGTMSAVGTALGPPLGGLLAAGVGWRSLFLVNVPIGLVNLALAWRHLPADRPRSGARPVFDHAGTLLLAATLAAYALAMTCGPAPFGARNLALLAAAAMAGGLFVLTEARVASPLIRLSMLRDPVLGASLAAGIVVAAVIMSTFVVGPFYLSRTLGLDTARVGLVLAVGPCTSALAGVPSGRLVDRFGARGVTLAGLAGMAFGCTLLALLPVAAGVAGYLATIVALTAGYALFQAANNTLVMASVAAEQRGVVAGLLSLSRNLGLVTGAAVMGAVFAAATGAAQPTAASAAAVAIGLHHVFAVAAVAIVAAIGLTVASRVRSAGAVLAVARLERAARERAS